MHTMSIRGKPASMAMASSMIRLAFRRRTIQHIYVYDQGLCVGYIRIIPYPLTEQTPVIRLQLHASPDRNRVEPIDRHMTTKELRLALARLLA